MGDKDQTEDVIISLLSLHTKEKQGGFSLSLFSEKQKGLFTLTFQWKKTEGAFHSHFSVNENLRGRKLRRVGEPRLVAGWQAAGVRKE